MVAKATVAAHLDISTSRLKGLIETKVIDDAEPGQMDLDPARRLAYQRGQAGAAVSATTAKAARR